MKNNNKIIEVLEYIKSFIENHGYPPTVREIGVACNLKSTATVKYYIDKLEKENYIKKSPLKNRCIEIIDDNFNKKSIKLPLVGNIRAGQPIIAEQNIEEYITIPTEIFNNTDDLFILRVEGESMIDAGIYDGDYIMVKRQNSANNGEIVAALIENSATVKRFYKEKNQFRLKAENSTMSDIIANEVHILGIVTGLIRKLK